MTLNDRMKGQPVRARGGGLPWILLPRPWLDVEPGRVAMNQSMRGRDGQPHTCEFLYRTGRRSRGVFVKGAIGCPGLDTIYLQYWHEVVMNTETQARAKRNLAFLD